MSFTFDEAHISAALVVGGSFGQFADPLDWLAEVFHVPTKVDRQSLMESMSYNRKKNGTTPVADAVGLDKHTRFRIQVAGTCERKLVGICQISFDPLRTSLRNLENYAIDIVTAFPERVLGVQASAGEKYHVLPGVETEKSISRLLPMNVFNRGFFATQIEFFKADKKLHVVEAGDAAVVLLTQNWKFYDVPTRKSKKMEPQRFLPFFK